MGLLCVASNAEGLSENIIDGETGWIVPKRNPNLLKQKIIEILQLSENEKNEIISNAVKRVEKEFNLKKQIDSFLRFYNE